MTHGNVNMDICDVSRDGLAMDRCIESLCSLDSQRGVHITSMY